MGAYDWPPPLGAVLDLFAQSGQRAVSSDDIVSALASLSMGAPLEPQPPLLELLTSWTEPTWFRLEESASDAERAVVVAKLVGAMVRAHGAVDGPGVLINIGSNGGGDVGLCVGLPATSSAAQGWSGGLATELMFGPGSPYGWSAVHGSTFEVAMISGTALPRNSPATELDKLPTFLEILLGGAGSLEAWSIDVVLRPLPQATFEQLRATTINLLLQAAQSVNRTASRSESDSFNYVDPGSERVVDILKQWLTLADDGLRVGAWTVATRIRASSADDLVSLAAGVQSALGEHVYVSHPHRLQSWSVAPVGPNADQSANWLSSRDVADLLLFSGHSVGRIQTRQSLASGRQMLPAAQPIDLGTWIGSSIPAQIDLGDLGAHGFIAGITGSGKSTTTRTVLSQIANRHGKPFLVIDPAKTDYEDFGKYLKDGMRVVQGRDIRLNVLKAWPGSDPMQHIARVSNAFRGSFALPSPVPYVVSILFEELAQEARYSEVTLHEGWARLSSLIGELNYRGEVEDNIKASLGLRLRLLLQPSRADRVACLGALPDWLIEGPTVVQLGDIADDEERNFLASMLVLYVSAAARQRGLSDQVQHLTVIEEAHRLMPEPRAVGSEDGDAGAVSARLMGQLLAEVRAYGESMLIIDQSPAAVSREVLRNTNVKLVHRIVDREDQQALGGALGLSDQESTMLGSLAVGRTLVSSRTFVQPQTAQVRFGLDVYELVELPDIAVPPSFECHRSDQSGRHHVAEPHGEEMEQVVAMWALGMGGDIHLRARKVSQRLRGTQPSCLLHVGLKRYVRTLCRVSYCSPKDQAGVFVNMWSKIFTGDPAPKVVASDQRPLVACVLCPAPCTARALVSTRTMPSYVRAERDMLRLQTSTKLMDRIYVVGDEVRSEIGTGSASPAIVACVRAHLAETFAVGQLLIANVVS